MLSDEEIMLQVLAAFQEEEAEHRQAITDILLELEREPNHPKQRELIDQLFREAHSMKGGARAAGQDGVEQIAHRIEDLFSAVRQGKLLLTPDVCDAIYAAIDAIGMIMNQVKNGHQPHLTDHTEVLDALSTILGERVEPSVESQTKPSLAVEISHPTPCAEVSERVSPQEQPKEIKPFGELSSSELPEDQQLTMTSEKPGKTEVTARIPDKNQSSDHSEQSSASGGELPWETVSTVRLTTATLDNILNETGELITCSVRAQQRATEARTLTELPVHWRRIWRHIRPILTRLQAYTPMLQPTVHHLNDRETDLSFAERAARILEHGEHGQMSTIASQLSTLIEALMQANTLITDMEQQLSIHARMSMEDYARLSAVTDRLHDQVRRTRMLPITTLFSPLRLQLREIARVAGKQVDLEFDDGGAEADRQVLERLREVLIHLLRNAVDHGIEVSDVRSARGKTPVGRIILRASVSGDYMTLVVEDDGAGLDIDNIRQRALQMGLLSETDLLRITESELVDLIFLPGFSTRQTVSKMSGRGVGLDIVRSQIERMHGRVTVQSFLGTGCVFTISVPLSLTSSHGLLLRIEQSTYMIPLDSVQRIVSVAPNDIKILEGRACLMYGERPLALVHLSDLLGRIERNDNREERRLLGIRAKDAISGTRASDSRWSLALLLGSGERQVACMVDAVLGEQELVVYRLPAPLHRVRFVAGATILADGSVVPILDVVDVIRAAIGARYTIDQTPESASVGRRTTILVVDDSITTRTLEKNILEAAGYQVNLATDGIEALETLRHLVDNGGCDLLLSDIDMPRLNGFDLTAQVRSDPLLKHIPIVLVTSLDTPADRERGITSGADAYIVKKSFDQQTLLDTIEQLI